jgi:hypothetical protein
MLYPEQQFILQTVKYQPVKRDMIPASFGGGTRNVSIEPLYSPIPHNQKRVFFSVQIRELSCDPYGCRVIQRILENVDPNQRTAVLTEVFATLESLIQDQYGNYVVQHILGRSHRPMALPWRLLDIAQA